MRHEVENNKVVKINFFDLLEISTNELEEEETNYSNVLDLYT